MSPENGKLLPETDAGDMNFNDTELTLGLPGDSRGTKRGFSDTIDINKTKTSISGSTKLPPKTQVVGWPPVKATRKSAVAKSCKYVKVAVDGAPYLRKVDLEMYGSYQQLLEALEELFSCLTIRNILNERKLMDLVNGVEYVPTYEDKDGDWMLVGDVPWKMFVESCKRVRLMKSSDAIGLAPRTPSRCTSTC